MLQQQTGVALPTNKYAKIHNKRNDGKYVHKVRSGTAVQQKKFHQQAPIHGMPIQVAYTGGL
jgi:hypothetical protein